jgi:hypothetical protein
MDYEASHRLNQTTTIAVFKAGGVRAAPMWVARGGGAVALQQELVDPLAAFLT